MSGSDTFTNSPALAPDYSREVAAEMESKVGAHRLHRFTALLQIQSFYFDLAGVEGLIAAVIGAGVSLGVSKRPASRPTNNTANVPITTIINSWKGLRSQAHWPFRCGRIVIQKITSTPAVTPAAAARLDACRLSMPSRNK